MDYLQKIVEDIELHDVEGIRQCFENGVNPNQLFRGAPLIDELTSEYTRSPRFKDCVAVFVQHGLLFDDPALLSVLLDDASQLQHLLTADHSIIHNKYSLRCAYTQMREVSLLHICAEFNHVACARILLKFDQDVNTKAGVDEYGFGGQTAIFHTVNQNSHASKEMMDLLLEKKATITTTVTGLIWGKGYDWETFIPAVNPISYAMMGLLPQMHRNEKIIAVVVSKLVKQAYGIDYVPNNVPNKYLR